MFAVAVSLSNLVALSLANENAPSSAKPFTTPVPAFVCLSSEIVPIPYSLLLLKANSILSNSITASLAKEAS